MNIKEMDLLEKQDTREKLVVRIEVLEKVKDLFVLPNTEYATTEQVARYYEVEENIIRQTVSRHSDELESDGIKRVKGSEVKDYYDTRDPESQVSNTVNIESVRGGILIDGNKLAYSSNTLFTKRAVLRVGMILKGSPIAKEVRTRLLNIVHDTEEQSPEIIEGTVNEMTQEQSIYLRMGQAVDSGNVEDILKANAELNQLKNKRINELKIENEYIKTNALTIIESRSVINRLVRMIAVKKYRGRFGTTFNELYSKLNYKLGINIKSRTRKKDESLLKTLTEKETFETEKIVRSWAVESGLDLDELLKIAG